MDAKQIKSRLQKVTAELLAITELLEEKTATTSHVKSDVCLFCQKQFEKSEKPIRGVHRRCRQKMRMDLISDQTAMASGWLLPPESGGRKKERPPHVASQLAKLHADAEALLKKRKSQ